jgi:signal transduction histidine kinase
MIRSLKSRILFAVVTLTTATLIAVTVMTWKNFKLEVEDLQKKLLRNILGSVTNIIESKYDELVKYEFESIGKRRMLMESMTGSVISALKSDYGLHESGVLSEDDAKAKSLRWIQNLTYGENQYFFVCDMNIIGLSHPIEGMIGRKWEGFKDLKQQDALLFMRDVVQNKKSGYTVFEWPILPQMSIIKQMAYFTYFPEWDWIIGTSVRIDDIEKDAHKKIDIIKRDLENIIPSMRIDESEQIYLFDGKGNTIVHPQVSHKEPSYEMNNIDYGNLINCLTHAVKGSDTPLEYPCPAHMDDRHADLTYADYYEPMDWYVAGSISSDAISRPVSNLIRRQIYILLAVLLVGISIAILFSNRLTGHLLLLAQYARDLPKKDLAADDEDAMSALMTRRIDEEVGYLIKAFTFMETQLRQTFRALTWESKLNSVFAEISSALIQSMQVDEISNLVLDQARQLTGSEYGYVGYIDPDTGNLICPTFIADIWDTCQVVKKRAVFEKFTGLWGWALTNRKSVLSNSPSDDPRSKGVPHGHVKIDRFLSSPALMGELLVGQISLANPGRDYTQKDLVLIERLASFYALAVQRKHTEDALAHSREQLRLLSSQLLETQEEERRRIAHDLHDSIGQSLAAIKFSVENVLNEVKEHQIVGLADSLQRIIPLVQNAMEEARKIYTGLRPSSLDDLGIIATISWFCREYQKTYTNIWIESQIDIEEEDIPEPLKIVIFRIVQESLNNIARHSEADWVDLSFVRSDGLIQLTIEDDGIGFDLHSPAQEAVHGTTLGITGMKERARLAGGDFIIESVIGGGTTVRASWSCQRDS